jgi:hypothetical protein
MSAASGDIDVNDAVLDKAIFPALPRRLFDLSAIRFEIAHREARAQVRGSEHTFLASIAIRDREIDPLLIGRAQLGGAPVAHAFKCHGNPPVISESYTTTPALFASFRGVSV